jgi:hypothetical protein
MKNLKELSKNKFHILNRTQCYVNVMFYLIMSLIYGLNNPIRLVFNCYIMKIKIKTNKLYN